MSVLSEAEKALMKSLASGVQAMLHASTIDPTSKVAISTPIETALHAIEDEALTGATAIVEDTAASIAGAAITAVGGDGAIEGPAIVAATVGEPLLERVENGVGAVVESMVDTAIRAVSGPLAPAAIEVANGLLEMLGRDAEQAIAALFHAKQSPKVPTVQSVAAALVAGDADGDGIADNLETETNPQ